jgi:hypothetical protein
MQRVACVLLIGLLNALPAAADADTDDDEAQPAAIMSELLAVMYFRSHGASPGLAEVLFGDINGDGQPDAIVTYSHGVGPDGGNHYSQRLALFLKGKFRWDLVQHMRIGAKRSRFIKPTRIDDGLVWFEESFWQAGDASCCPSGKREFAMKFESGKLK